MDCSNMSDEQLLLGYADNGDTDLFDELISRYRGELMRHLTKRIGPRYAEDVFQEVCIALHLKCGLFDGSRSLRPWLFTMATRKAIDQMRREGRHSRVKVRLDYNRDPGDEGRRKLIDRIAGEGPSPPQAAISDEEAVNIRGSVQSLPEIYKECVSLHYLDGLGYREIAEKEGVPVGTIKSRMNAGLRKLRAAA